MIRELEELAKRAGPAIENARRFREARQLADLDALTGLHNRRYFHETLAREVARAQRYGRQLALIVFDLDDFKAINDQIGHLSGDAVLAETAERVRDVVRSADIACRVGGDEFAVILPESSTADADQLYHRLRGAVSSRPVGQAGRLFLSAGIADLLADDGPTSFFERADGALYRAKELGKGQVWPPRRTLVRSQERQVISELDDADLGLGVATADRLLVEHVLAGQQPRLVAVGARQQLQRGHDRGPRQVQRQRAEQDR
jgi:diguanylate cyclase (GGDEF)-like protein